MTVVYLEDSVAELLKILMSNYTNLSALIEGGVFNLKSSTIKINIDPNGIITGIESTSRTFDRRKKSAILK